MKDYIQIIIIFIVFLMFIPAIAFLNHSDSSSKKASSKSFNDIDSVKIYFTDEKKCRTYTLEEYLIGAVFAQMPADFNTEALKAQAILAHTYILKRSQSEKTSPTDNLNGALISNNAKLYQGFFTEKQAKDFYGKDYEKSYKKIKSAVKAVENYILTYENQPIIVAFHAVSSGQTQSSKIAWGEELPYLQSVESPQDKKMEAASVELSFSIQQLQEKLSAVYDDIKFSDSNESSWIKLKSDEKTGYVTTVNICGKEISSSEFIEILDISSPCFTVEFSENKFIFKSMGYGHLVGMSQYGANAMAESGKKYQEILKHYFVGCEISS